MGTSLPQGTSTGFALGLACLAIAVFVWSASLAGWLPDPQVVAMVSIFTGGLGLLVTGLVALRENAIPGGAFYVAFSTFWFATGFSSWFMTSGMKDAGADMAWVFAAWTVFLGINTVMTTRMKAPLLTLASALLALQFLLVWVSAAFNTGDIVLKAAGISGMLTSLIAAFLFYQIMWREAA